jgi:hypothetical protein
MACGSRPVVVNTDAMAPTATQETLAQVRQAAAAPVAVHNRGPRPVSRGNVVANGRHRVRGQQIIRRRPG